MTKKQKRERNRILLAAGLYLILAAAEHFLGGALFENRLLKFLLYLIPYLVVGSDVVKGALRGIMGRDIFNEEFLMTLATVGAFVVGEDAEAVAVMLFYSVGELFQSYAVGKSRKSITELMDIAPEYANLLLADGSMKTVDPDSLKEGDAIAVKPGERIPIDGTVLEGSSMIDTKAITGESVPRSVHEGEAVISGCINGSGLLKVRVDKAYCNSTVARILELVENASARKSPIENFITKFARYYTPVVVISAAVLAVIPPLVIGGGFLMWIQRACTFLVISCPCALVLSVPLTFFGGIGAASRVGVLVKGSNYLEALGEMEIFVSDKTGTLTKGNFVVSSLHPASASAEEDAALLADEAIAAQPARGGLPSAASVGEAERSAEEALLLETAAYAECFSDHPIAQSIRAAYGKQLVQQRVSGTENLTGKGIRAQLDGVEICAGNGALMDAMGISYTPEQAAGTVVYVARAGQFLGSIVISDTIKEEAREAIRQLKAQGVREVVMLTGDRKAAAEETAKRLGIDTVRAELLPDQKVRCVDELEQRVSKKGKLAFVGDGINDAPVLARADVGIAMGSMGSDAAIEAADAVIMDDNILKIPAVSRIARQTIAIAKQNIVFALAVKALVLVLGALGLANMWAAVFADVGVAVLCILNAMRMLRAGREQL